MTDHHHNPAKLHIRGHTPNQLVLRVIDALDVEHGLNQVQMSGLQRFAKQLDPSSAEDFTIQSTEEDELVGRYFNLFDALFFGRSLRYVVTTKIKIASFPSNTCCRGVISGGRLVVMVEKESPNWKSSMLGRLLHDMIHVYLWRYGKSSFVNNALFEKGWGFSGHGTAWQDIAILLDSFLECYGLVIPVGRVESLHLELESFSDWVAASFMHRKTETSSKTIDKSQIVIKDLKRKADSPITEMSRHMKCSVPHCYECSNQGQSRPIMLRQSSRLFRRAKPTQIIISPPQKLEEIRVSVVAPAHITAAQVKKMEEKPVSLYALEIREFLLDSADAYAGTLETLVTEKEVSPWDV